MKKITMVNGDVKYHFLIQDYKIILGSNESLKFEIIKIFYRIYLNQKISEYAIEFGNVPQILINDMPIKFKDCMLFYVHKYYSISDDLKLHTKSLIAKYLEILFSNDSFKDTLNTINLLFDSLRFELQDYSTVDCEFNAISPKQLLKLVSAKIIEDDLFKDEYDMTIDEIILFQLDLISFIVNHSFSAHYLILLEINSLSEVILKKVKSLPNCEILLFVERCNIEVDLDKIAICEKWLLDLGDEEIFYEKICDNNYRLLSLEEGRDYMKHYLYIEDSEKRRFIKKIIG